MNRTALAFMSYVNENDRHDNGWMTQFRERLSGEVWLHTGEPFDIFQDRKDIAWGQQWQERINDALDATLFLIPILTPAFFKSAACRDELERFLKREETLGRSDLVLPVYYVNCPVLQDKAKREQDELAKTIAARQYADWRELRFEEFTSAQLRKALAKMAQQIMEALERSQAEASRKQPEKESEKRSSSINTFQSSGGTQNVAQGSNPIGTQINNYYALPPQDAKPKPAPAQLMSRIRIYDLAKEVGLKSKDFADRLAAMGYPVKSASSTIDDKMAADIRRKVLSKVAAEIKIKTLVVDQQCLGDYVTITEALKAAKPGTRILVRPGLYNEGIIIDKPVKIIGDGERSEIVIEGTGRNTVSFYADKGRIANLIIRQVAINESHYWLPDFNIYDDDECHRQCVAVDICRGSLELEDCDISSQSLACVAIHSGADPFLRRNYIHDGAEGVFIHNKGQGTLEDNEIVSNVTYGIEIIDGGNPTLHRNHISLNNWEGIHVCEDGGGIFEENDLRGNKKGAWRIAPDCEANVQRRGNKE